MQFRPCIDIHNGKVKQIVGSTLSEDESHLQENFEAESDAADFARLYKEDHLIGGHVILLNGTDSPFYAADQKQALSALSAYPLGLMAGGGITPENAGIFLNAGASHVIVTSYVFLEGRIAEDRLLRMCGAVGKEHLVLDLSCRRRPDRAGEDKDPYFVVTDRWQRFTDEAVSLPLLDHLSAYCDEFLIHAADAEGKSAGIETDLISLLGQWDGIPITYAGGVAGFSDLEQIREMGHGKISVTIGSALDLFGGPMSYRDVLRFCDPA